ncbi:L,D-transpeptidase family protein [Adlercreutzia sp. ZJ154]|uniref:L,D-transpeptidase family protein n=1 Tax=Adlercreutzia sp. ZJ154 TaxID=2709790 RepID=UPI0013E9B488|nr:L,D-transpeptidase family protein [Adlercreutzia sp. ZJ154]
MAKHSKGKHVASSVKGGNAAEQASVSAEIADSKDVEAAKESGLASQSEEPKNSEKVENADAPAVDAPEQAVKSGQVVESAASSASTPADAPADAPAVDASAGTPAGTPAAAPAGTPANISVSSPVQPDRGVSPSSEAAQGKRHNLRTALIASACVVVVLGGLYLGGVALFSTHFMPNTNVAGIDFSLKTPQDMQATLDNTLANHTFSVVGKGLNFKVSSEDVGLTSDNAAVAQDIISKENPWMWPVEIFNQHDCTDSFTESMHADGLDAVVSSQLEVVNADAVQPTNATIAFDEGENKFVCVEETKGTAIDADALKNTILEGLLHLEDKITLTDAVLVQPTILVDDPRVQAAADQANEYVKAEFDVVMSDTPVVHVDPKLTSQWVSVSPELEVGFDEAALSAWAADVASACNTVGSKRTYTRPDGKQITVSGGTYGWKIDRDALVTQVTEAVKAGSTQPLTVPVLQSGTGFNGLGGQDWGSRYIDVDLSEQYARFYDNGSLIWESVIVSGNPNKGKSTPTGVYSANQKASPTVLRGRIQSDGKPEYESPVKYWMPFIGNSVGFHDASWQSAYGGGRYLTNGSRGCINLPYNAAESLYGIIKTGDVVVVHG